MVHLDLTATPEARSKLSRGLALLACFRAEETELTLSELARRTRLPKPTVHRLIKELVDWGLLERGPGGVRLGHGLFLLGSRAPWQRRLREVASPFLERLHDVTRRSTYLSVLDGTSVVHLEGIRSPAPPADGPWRAEQGEVCAGAVGRAMLAHTPGGPALREELSRVARQGYAVATGRLRSVAVAVPVLHPTGYALAGITVFGPLDGVRLMTTVRHAQGAAAATVAQLGAVEPR
ncbi:IclR family transcriptional regulator [Streptomyces sp. UNOB3_S3]|uniref:IclR family transcriptional regulator n=1 Tax=Streptomyces sp. UNOB3_S3 TaxID=2871682 RepID=UPI001E2C7D10|nr:helix-turn-helix domain-containing protein [Streptomyces sp. UNOB3_S3]MCC3773901.1 helix-turn-helix domain-containing protein [Streptomyces sp. UNOB3_S3]